MTTLSVTQAAARLNVHPATVRRWCAAGILPAQRLGARSWMIDAEALDTFKAPRRGPPRKAPVDK